MGLTGSPGRETSISQSIAAAVGLMAPLVPSLIESISPEKEHGLILLSLLKFSSTVRLEEVAMEATLEKYMSMLKNMESQKKLAKLMKLRTLINSAVRIYRNA